YASWLYPRALEGHVNARQEIPHRRLAQEVGDAEVELAGLADLRIRAPVLRPGGEVSTGDGQAQRARADAGGPGLGGEVRQRYFTQLEEPRVLEESGLEPIVHGGVRRCLVGERRLGQVEGAADRELSTELFGGVIELVAPPPVQQSVQAEVLQKVDLGAERGAAGRHRGALERIRTADRELTAQRVRID